MTTPRTDKAWHLAPAASFEGITAMANHARQLERELHQAQQCASDNSDWFGSLVEDLSKILGCEKSASAVIQAATELKRRNP